MSYDDLSESVIDHVVELRDVVMKALLKDGSRTSAEIDEWFDERQCVYPPDEEFEFLDWQAMNVLLALYEVDEMLTPLTRAEFDHYRESQKTIYSPCVLDPSLVKRI